MKPVLVHGTAISYAGIGLLITGASGAGKSLLALDLMSGGGPHGPARLVADDQVELSVRGEHLWARAPDTLSGLIELRGRGIIERHALGQTRIELNIVISSEIPRLPEPGTFKAKWLGVTICAAPVAIRSAMDVAHQRLLVDEAVATIVGGGEKIT
jgi:serine kinase of HPr protein (carbohydrate metabolism regulator)